MNFMKSTIFIFLLICPRIKNDIFVIFDEFLSKMTKNWKVEICLKLLFTFFVKNRSKVVHAIIIFSLLWTILIVFIKKFQKFKEFHKIHVFHFSQNRHIIYRKMVKNVIFGQKTCFWTSKSSKSSFFIEKLKKWHRSKVAGSIFWAGHRFSDLAKTSFFVQNDDFWRSNP